MSRLFILILAALLTVTHVYAQDDGQKKDHTPTYQLDGDISMRSTVKYEYGKKMIMKYVYPQLTTETEDEYIDQFNTLTLNIIDDVAQDFKQKVADNQSTLKLLPSDLAKANNTLNIDYNSSTIKSGKNYILSVRFSVVGMIVGMAHPYHFHRILNYNLETGKQIELDELFKPDSDYLLVLSSYAHDVLEKRLADKDLITEGTTPTPENFKCWNIKPNGLLITFEDAQVAPHSDGVQTVLVPYTVLKPLIADDAVIASCVKHHKRCANSNLLTGGFIDEASASSTRSSLSRA